MSSLGIFIVIVQCISMIWGNEVKVLRQGIDAVFTVGSITLTRAQIVAAAVSCGLLLAFYFWLRFSKLGFQFRALADNPTQLALFGYNTRRLRFLAFGIAGLLAAASSLLVAFDLGFDPHSGRWMEQIARNLIDGYDGFLNDWKYLIHDRSVLYTEHFQNILLSAGIQSIGCQRAPQI